MFNNSRVWWTHEGNKEGLVIKNNREFCLDSEARNIHYSHCHIFTLLWLWVNSVSNPKNNNNKIRRRIKAFPPGCVFVNPSIGLVLSLVQLPTSPLSWEEGNSGPSPCLRMDPSPLLQPRSLQTKQGLRGLALLETWRQIKVEASKIMPRIWGAGQEMETEVHKERD